MGWFFSWTQTPFSHISFFFWPFPFTIQNAFLAFALLHKLNSGILGDTADSSCWPTKVCGYAFFEWYLFPWCQQCHPFCSFTNTEPKDNPRLSEKCRGHVSGVSSLSLCVCHFGRLLAGGGSSPDSNVKQIESVKKPLEKIRDNVYTVPSQSEIRGIIS